MDNFWIEAGDMSGGSRNQIEFDEELVAFFTSEPPSTGAKVTLAISVHGRSWTDCDLTAKVTSFGVDIYRLGLVTAAKGGEDYAGRVIRFEKNGGRYFAVTVTDHGSAEHQEWRAASVGNSTLGRTGGAGGREFGYF